MLVLIVLNGSKGGNVSFKRENAKVDFQIISLRKASRLIRKRCEGYLCCAVENSQHPPKPPDIPMASEFLDVFSDKLPRLPPKRDIDFEIQLLHSSLGVCIDYRELNKINIGNKFALLRIG